MRRRIGLAATMAAVAAAATCQAADFEASPDAMRAHVTFLASDLLAGRMAGSPGFDIAASYVVSQYTQLGVKPAGDGGDYRQGVPLAAYRPAGKGSFALRGPGGAKMAFGVDYRPIATPLTAHIRLRAPLVFAGYGVVAPEIGRDDFAGLDLKGKIVVVLTGAPKRFPSEQRAYYASSATKQLEAARRGAIGYIVVDTPASEKLRPFAKGARGWRNEAMSWVEPGGRPHVVAPGAPALARVSLKGAAKLLAGAPASLEAIMAAAERPAGDPPRFALPLSADIALDNEIRTGVKSANVVGLIEGADPKLKNEFIVLSAHLDHLGVTEPVAGDAINNGAMDNATGVATLLEVARGFKESRQRPRRSILLLAVTGEEEGLLGAEYFALHPTVARAGLAADVNLDMPVLTYPFTDVVAFGADRSSIGPSVRRAAQGLGVELSPDPLPDEGLFTRSDHYRFVQQGVPAVFLMTGFANGGEAAFADFLAHHYHQPSDDLSLPIDYVAGARFASLNYAIARELADTPARPRWNPGDFFGDRFAPKP